MLIVWRQRSEEGKIKKGSGYEPMLQSTMIGLVFWLVCYWIYRQKLFIRV